MRYPKHHKDAARQRLVEQTGSHAKQHGFAESGVAALAAAAGLTTGALYKHFDGKAELFAALVQAELARTAQMLAAIDSDEGTARMLAGYLSPAHVRHPERGCALPALTPEIARADDAARQAYQAGLLEVHAELQRLSGGDADSAWVLLAQLVGAVMLARALPEPALQKKVLDAARGSCAS
ncbi:TetR family transcriptional regulator [Rivibacter subsaxonicus]|uniref:TetR family transcriptional regulator n=1 Tax=Rivibacter subsaxonicus TaxID=457575 RepID=A0A4Q7VZI2_9BURK|nr:TetR family transcriptional regulator [Rivibacter subsaxonicus]RZU02247.1 TetR family transcriptional regulator [Rivibacter subsaxonicus]